MPVPSQTPPSAFAQPVHGSALVRVGLSQTALNWQRYVIRRRTFDNLLKPRWYHRKITLFAVRTNYDCSSLQIHRGRELGCPSPTAQIRTCALTHPAPTSGVDDKPLARPQVTDGGFRPMEAYKAAQCWTSWTSTVRKSRRCSQTGPPRSSSSRSATNPRLPTS